MGARIDLATACLMQHELDEAEETLGYVFTIPSSLRNVSLSGGWRGPGNLASPTGPEIRQRDISMTPSASGLRDSHRQDPAYLALGHARQDLLLAFQADTDLARPLAVCLHRSVLHPRPCVGHRRRQRAAGEAREPERPRS